MQLSLIRGLLFGNLWLVALLASSAAEPAATLPNEDAHLRTFDARGVVVELKPERDMVTIRHEVISNYMAAMTMPFHVKHPEEMRDLRVGDEIIFQLDVTDRESWIEQIRKTGTRREIRQSKISPEPDGIRGKHPLLDYPFTNELGRVVRLSDFHGQALAITFFFTRCPIPDYCPRLSKNFQEASRKLAAVSGAPPNWHFLSVTFDPNFDTPAVLKAYGESYGYNPERWSFLTGPAEKIDELAQQSGVEVEREGSLINHNFRTLIIDASGHLQPTFLFGGDLSDVIVNEMIKAAAATNVAAGQTSQPLASSATAGASKAVPANR